MMRKMKEEAVIGLLSLTTLILMSYLIALGISYVVDLLFDHLDEIEKKIDSFRNRKYVKVTMSSQEES